MGKANSKPFASIREKDTEYKIINPEKDRIIEGQLENLGVKIIFSHWEKFKSYFINELGFEELRFYLKNSTISASMRKLSKVKFKTNDLKRLHLNGINKRSRGIKDLLENMRSPNIGHLELGKCQQSSLRFDLYSQPICRILNTAQCLVVLEYFDISQKNFCRLLISSNQNVKLSFHRCTITLLSFPHFPRSTTHLKSLFLRRCSIIHSTPPSTDLTSFISQLTSALEPKLRCLQITTEGTTRREFYPYMTRCGRIGNCNLVVFEEL
ncbi:unnamed protein product [Moneuplotes crassus]|uniref:Uncharacterized protein n=1 Tax=Euplotes crassus TaxID=5936 RepID=A0AAD2D3I5_EUPCR|nr:unnamed protein product [Moneuplotes crassus]